ncbi:hypothetical protein ACQUEV_16335 [Enterococcus gallinarum]|uniref:hypothetical protein n=1 Tax=Enterococcus gallinarum TaxID=1353 RepID=UPI003D128585
MKTEDDFFSYREWKKYLEEQQMKQELEGNPDAIKKLSLVELNKLIEEDSTNEIAIERRKELLAQYKKERVTQIKEPKKTVVSKLKEKIKGANQA